MRAVDGAPRPYLGLKPFEAWDELFFFGREEEVSVLAANLRAARVTVLYGGSGVGKSSLVKAGLGPELLRRSLQARDGEGAAETLASVVLSVGHADPSEAVAAQVVRATRVAAPSGAPGLEAVGPLYETVVAALQHVGRLFVALDQFEEYLGYARGAERDRFAPDFLRLLSQRSLPVHFMLSLREDTVAMLDHFRGRTRELLSNPVRVSPLSAQAARLAIREPLARLNEIHGGEADIEDALVDELIRETRPGRLEVELAGGGVELDGGPARDAVEVAYLQLALDRVWEVEQAQGSSLLRLKTFRDLGKIAGIVREHLDRSMGRLSNREQDVAAESFRWLVSPSGLKIPNSGWDLAKHTRFAEKDITPVLSKLSEGEVRILRPVGLSPRGDQLYELFHDRLGQPILDWRARQRESRSEFTGVGLGIAATATIATLTSLVLGAVQIAASDLLFAVVGAGSALVAFAALYLRSRLWRRGGSGGRLASPP